MLGVSSFFSCAVIKSVNSEREKQWSIARIKVVPLTSINVFHKTSFKSLVIETPAQNCDTNNWIRNIQSTPLNLTQKIVMKQNFNLPRIWHSKKIVLLQAWLTVRLSVPTSSIVPFTIWISENSTTAWRQKRVEASLGKLLDRKHMSGEGRVVKFALEYHAIAICVE